MDSLDGQNDIDWSSLSPPKSDRYQIYVFVAHLVLGVLISVLSYSYGLFFWAVGPGILTPVLLFGTGLFYAQLTGINWYRDEFIPFLNSINMMPVFETDGFLRYKRVYRVIALIAGYLSVAISQIVWYQGVSFLLATIGPGSIPFEMMIYIFIGMLIFFIILVVVFVALFNYTLRKIYSDVDHITSLDDRMTDHFHTLRKAEKEKAKEAQKRRKEDKKPRKERSE